jgi:hypothetical protein
MDVQANAVEEEGFRDGASVAGFDVATLAASSLKPGQILPLTTKWSTSKGAAPRANVDIGFPAQ